MCACIKIGQYSKKGMYYCQEQEYDKSLEYLHKALEITLAMDAPVNESKILNSIGIVLHLAGDTENSHIMFDHAIDTLVHAKGEGHPLVAHFRKNKAMAQDKAA